MARDIAAADAAETTPQLLLSAARRALLESGFAALSTRKVAESAGVPLSQIHYHFGSKVQLILAMLEAENDALLRRQDSMFRQDIPLSMRWDIACDYLDDDLESGYVRVLQEMMAAGWSSPEVRQAVSVALDGWNAVLTDVLDAAQEAGVNLGPFEANELAALVGAAFLGAESVILLGMESDSWPLRTALRRVGEALRTMEEIT